KVEGKLKPGNIKIGIGFTQVSDFRRDRTLLDWSGNVIFKGKCKIGAGSRISVAKNALLQFGDQFNMTSNSSIICRNNIQFGTETLISWHCLLMDTDQHQIFDQAGNRTNQDHPIVIGNHVWIAAHSILLKGTQIPDDCVVAAGSRLNSKIEEKNVLIAGNPAQITKHNIRWK
ncbi:MAG: acyltransferase, partial [Bacteroidales bacterium]